MWCVCVDECKSVHIRECVYICVREGVYLSDGMNNCVHCTTCKRENSTLTYIDIHVESLLYFN